MSCFSSLIKSCTNWWYCSGFPIGSDSCECTSVSFWKTVALRMCPWILPKCFKRYVDYIFVMFLCQSRLNDFVNYTNILQFTWIALHSEFEKNESFFFLDVKITPSNNQLVTPAFCMATFSGVFTNLQFFWLSHTSLA